MSWAEDGNQLAKAPPMFEAPSSPTFSISMRFDHGEEFTAGPTLSLTGNSPVGTVTDMVGSGTYPEYSFVPNPPWTPATPGFYSFNAIIEVTMKGTGEERVFKVDPKMIVEPG